MLIATETRKAIVHGTFLNPSTKRREVVKPTSKTPPRMSQNQAMFRLRNQLADCRYCAHGEQRHEYQSYRPVAFPLVLCCPGCCLDYGDRRRRRSDVAITSPHIRKVVTVHCAVGFFFNLGVLALTVNVLGSR
jgi:hypothetical protein